MARQVWGIDIGHSALKAVKLRPLRNGVELTEVAMIPYEEAGGGEQGRDRGTWQALAEFQERYRVHGEKVVVSVPGGDTFTRTLNFVMVGKKSVHELVQYEAQQQIPFVLDEVIWDYHLFEPDEANAREREGVIFAVKKNLLNNYFLSLSSANLPVDDVQTAPLGLYNFFRYDQDTGAGCLVVDVGSDSTNIVGISGDDFWVRSVPVGGREATELLAEGFGMDFARAEAAKLNLAKSKHAREILEVLMPAMGEIVGEVQKSLTYQRAEGRECEYERAYLVGGSANLIGLRTFLARTLNIEVLSVEQFGQIMVSDQANVRLLQDDLGCFLTATGLAIQGCGRAACEVSLIPRKTAQRTMLGRAKSLLMAIPAVILVALLTAYGFARQRNIAMERLYETVVKDQLDQIDSLQTRLKQASDVSKVRKKIQQLEALGRGRAVWLDLLNELMKVLPDNNRAAVRTKGKVWLIDLDVRGFKPVKGSERSRVFGVMTAGTVMGKDQTASLFRIGSLFEKRLKENPRFVTDSIRIVSGEPKAELQLNAADLVPGKSGYFIVKVEFEFYATP